MSSNGTSTSSGEAPWLQFVREAISGCFAHTECAARDLEAIPICNDCDCACTIDGPQCENLPSHEEGRSSTTLPTRLVEIRDTSNGIKDVVLIETKHNSSISRYATLSHSWGDSKTHNMLKTYLNNYNDMMKNIPWASLPATFQDAITICRHLDIKHIWIDSLCIIQGNTPDFPKEAVKMCDYYGNSYLTISGTCSSGCTTPFLEDGAPKRIYPKEHEPVDMLVGPDDTKVRVRKLTAEESTWIPHIRPRQNPSG